MLLQMNAITAEPSHPDCVEETELETLVDYRVPLEDGGGTRQRGLTGPAGSLLQLRLISLK